MSSWGGERVDCLKGNATVTANQEDSAVQERPQRTDEKPKDKEREREEEEEAEERCQTSEEEEEVRRVEMTIQNSERRFP